jgi:hypothetical protein
VAIETYNRKMALLAKRKKQCQNEPINPKNAAVCVYMDSARAWQPPTGGKFSNVAAQKVAIA